MTDPLVTPATPTAPSPTPAPGTPEYDAAMAAKFDGQTGAGAVTPPTTPSRPDYVPEKFWDATTGTIRTEELAKSYAALEQKVSAPADTTKKEDASTEDKATQAVENAGLDMAALQAQFDANGTLDDASYAALEKAGITRDIVDSYIDNLQAKATLVEMEAYNMVGGKEQYAAMGEWAKANFTDAELAAYNAAVVGSEDQRKLALEGLKARYTAASGSEPDLLSGSGAANGVDAFASLAQLTAAIRDPKYKTDPAYRASIEAKLSRSNL